MQPVQPECMVTEYQDSSTSYGMPRLLQYHTSSPSTEAAPPHDSPICSSVSFQHIPCTWALHDTSKHEIGHVGFRLNRRTQIQPNTDPGKLAHHKPRRFVISYLTVIVTLPPCSNLFTSSTTSSGKTASPLNPTVPSKCTFWPPSPPSPPSLSVS